MDDLPVRVSWVKNCNFHLTIHFLGQVHEDILPRLKTLLDRVTEEIPPFYLCFDRPGFFAGRGRVRTIWIGISKDVDRPLLKLHEILKSGLQRLGFNTDTRAYSAHLTLGRVRGNLSTTLLGDRFRSMGEVSLGTEEVIELCLFKSELAPGQSPEYTCLHSAGFCGGAL